ncbi:MAG: hypothetical protein Kow0029_11940 [Candidatus Rifleibacteriota bacterium]
MPKKQKTIILFLVAWIGTGILLIAGLLRLPVFLSEREKLLQLNAKLADSNAIESRMKTFLADFSNDAELLKADISRREKILADNEFKCPSESSIPEFINELQQLFYESGASIINLGYEKREQIESFVILPFSAEIRADYQSMRKVLHALETNPFGIKIDKLKFLSLNDEEHLIRFKVTCSVRFEKSA